MKFLRTVALSSLALIVLGLFSGRVWAVEDEDIPAEGITQGEFALWVVEAAGVEGKLPPAALASDAVKFLQNLGVKPKDGWDSEKKLTSKDLVEMLGLADKDASGKSWTELIKMLITNIGTAVEQLGVNSDSSVSPSVSPGGSR